MLGMTILPAFVLWTPFPDLGRPALGIPALGMPDNARYRDYYSSGVPHGDADV
jgi:hypothetical protein